MPALDAPRATRPRATRPRPAWHGLTDACAFALEIAMLVLLAVTGTRIGAALAVHVILAIALPAIALAIWATWAAPGSTHTNSSAPKRAALSRRRLADPWRLVAQIVLFAITAGLAAAAGLLAWGVIFAVLAAGIFSLTRLYPPPPPRSAAREAG